MSPEPAPPFRRGRVHDDPGVSGDEQAFIEARVAEGLAARLIRGSRDGVVGHLMATVALGFIFSDRVDRYALSLWLVVLLAAILVRHLVVWGAHARGLEPGRVFPRLFLSVVLVGVAWAMGATVLPGGAGTEGMGLATVLFAGLVAFSSSTLVAHPLSFHVYTAILILSALGVELLVGEEMPGMIAGLLLGLFWVAMIATHRSAHRELRASLRSAALVEWNERKEGVERQILEGLLRASPGVVFIVDRDERIVRVNQVAARMSGGSAETLVGRKLDDLIERREVMDSIREISAVAWESGSAGGVVFFPRADGGARWFRLSAARGRGSVGDTMFLQAEDVTSLKEAEAAREEAQALYRGLVDSATDLVWRVDAEGRWVFLNQAARQIYGLAPEEMVGRSMTEFMSPEVVERDWLVFHRLLAGEPLRDHETVHCDVHGNPRRLSFSAQLVLDAAGQVAGTQGTARDVTERVAHRDALEQVAEQAELIRSLLNASQDLIFIKDASGVYRGCNQAFARQLGREHHEIVGKTDWDLYPEWRAAAFMESDEEAFRTRKVLVLEEWEETPGGEKLVLLQTFKTPQFAPDGTPRGVIGIARDVTDSRIQAERARQAAREAERASLMKTSFLANMSHEIRTPMNGVLGMTEILLDSGLTGEQVHFAEMVRSSAVSLLAILNDVLDLSKIEAGRMELEEVPFDLPGTVAGCVRMLAMGAADRGDELLVDLRPEVPQGVVGDPARLRQVLTNLVGNAIKFTRSGEVMVSVSVAEDAGDLQWVNFAVRDTGIGIEPGKLESIFEEFQQADLSTTRMHGGTGLGLAISRRLVRMMGGEISVRSVFGEGSEFSFLLPFRRANEDEIPRETGREPGALSGARVLVLDDSATNRRILREFLEAEEVTVDEADTVDVGLASARRAAESDDAYDAVIVDIQMPARSGFDFLEEIRGDPVLSGLRAMILASALNPGDGPRGRALGVGVALQKPASRDEVLTGLSRVLAMEVITVPHEPGAPARSSGKPFTDEGSGAGGLGPTGSAGGSAPGRQGPPELLRRTDLDGGPAPGSMRILVAEDNPVNQQIALAMLEKRGHRVEVVPDGAAAVRSVQETAPDLVLMDVQMPVMDGLEATRRIRLLGFHDLPIVAVTAHALSEERQRCRDAGMNDFLAKPFRAHALLAMVDRWGPDVNHPVDEEVGEPEGAASVLLPTSPDGHRSTADTTVQEPGPAGEGAEESSGEDPGEGGGQWVGDGLPGSGGGGEAGAGGDPPAPPVDLDEFRAVMREAGIEAVVPITLQIFQTEAPRLMTAIRDAATAEEDASGVASAAHAYKSSAGNVRAKGLYTLLGGLEAAARDGDLEEARRLVHRVDEVHAQVLEFLAEHEGMGA